MILLISSSPAASKCALHLHQQLGKRIHVSRSVPAALSLLRADNDFAAIVIDELLAEASAEAVDPVLRQAGTAVTLFVNLAIQSPERITRAVRGELERREREQLAAMEAARRALRNELKAELTGILLSSQMALATPAIPSAAEAKLRSVCALAEKMKQRLEC